MKLFMKKVLTVVLSVMMLVVFMPTSAFAVGDADSGNSNGNDLGAPAVSKKLQSNGDGTYDLSLTVKGKSQHSEDSTKADVIIVFDKSSSMWNNQSGGKRRLEVAQEATRLLARTLLANNTAEAPDKVHVGLVTFAYNAYVEHPMTNNADSFNNTVNNIETEKGTNWEAALKKAREVSTRSDADKYVIFISDGEPSKYLDDNGIVMPSGQNEFCRNEEGYQQAKPEAVKLGKGGYKFYGISAFGTYGNIKRIVAAAGADSNKNYFDGSDKAKIEAAFQAIVHDITQDFSYKKVSITDGVTSLTSMVNVDGEVGDFKYYKNGKEWTDAPAATFNNGSVTWNLGENYRLENDAEYKVSFTVWPSQRAYDIATAVANGILKYGDTTIPVSGENVTSDEWKQLTNDGKLKTNTSAMCDYTQIKEETGKDPVLTPGRVGIPNPDPIPLANTKLTVSKEWIGEEGTGNIQLMLIQDGKETGKTVTLNKNNKWAADVYIAPGLKVDGNELEGGHDYTLEEVDTGYKYEFVSTTCHPMLINSATVITNRDGSTCELKGTNTKRSDLEITKTVEGKETTDDTLFTYSVTVEDKNGDNVWFSIGDGTGIIKAEDRVTGATAEAKDGAKTGYYYANSNTPVTIKIKAGENIFFTNLPKGSTYKVEEINLPDGYKLQKVVDNGKEQTNPKAEGTIGENNKKYTVAYTNQYTASEAAITLHAKKILKNLDLGKKQFSFQLIDSEGKVIDTKQTDANGNVTFEQLKYGAEGTYEYKVKEVLPDGVTEDNPKKDGITYDVSVKNIKVKVEDNSKGQLVASVIEGSQTSTFTNIYNASGESTVKGLKTLQSETGKTLVGGEFKFEIIGDGPLPENTSVMNDANGIVDFGKINFTLNDLRVKETKPDNTVATEAEGPAVDGDNDAEDIDNSEPAATEPATTKPAEKTFTYTVKETGNMPGVNNDSDKTFRITIKDDGKGGIIATTDPAGDYAFTFNNVHTAAAVNPGVNKAFIYSTGEPAWGEYSNAEFEFTLEAITEGAPMPATTTVKATKDELDPYFGVIKFNEPGTYEYTIKEKQGNLKNVTYDTSAHNVEVVVTETDDKSLSAAIKYDGNDSLTITNTVEKTSVSGEKNWEDEALQETGKYTRPESITVQLMADGTAVKGKTQTVTADNSWKYTFDNLDKYDENGDEIEYSVVETKIGGKDVSESGFEVKYSGYNITNTPKDAEKLIPVALSIIKTDANTGQGLAGAVFKITKNGETAEKVTEKTDSDGKTTFTFEEEGTYVVAEKTAPKGYDATETRWSVEVEKGEITEIKVIEGFWTKIYQLIFGNGTDSSIEGDTLTVANPPEKTKVPVEKKWDDNDNQDRVRPDSVTVSLFADGEATEKTLVLDADNGWKGEFDELDAYKNGKKIDYTVEEATVEDYTLKDITGDAKNGYVITNEHTPELTSISGSKTWNDAALKETGKYTRPESITVRLLADGKAVDDQTQTVTADDNWTYEFENLDKYKDGEEITYTVEEIKVGNESVSEAGFTATYDDAHLNVTNTPAMLKVTKHLNKFDEPLVAENTTFYVALFSDKDRTERVAGPQELKFNGTSSTYTVFTGLVPNKNYYVGETDADGNILGEGESRGVEVLPIDGEDHFVEIGTSSYLDYDSKVVIGEDTSKEFKNFVREVPPPGHYHQFTLTKAVTDIEGTEKEYSDDFYVGVYTDENHEELVQGLKDENGKALDNPVKLTLNNASSASITVEVPELDKPYFLAETDADGNPVDSEFRFIHEFSGDIDENDSIIVREDSDVNVTLTNKDRELIDIGFDLEWDDYSNRDNTRDEYKVTLYADGVKVGEEITCKKDENIKGESTYKWTDLPKYNEDGELIEYTVKETGVPEKYTSNTDGKDYGIGPDKEDGIIHLSNVYRAFTLTKKVVDSKGKAAKYTGDFYVTLYTDAECTQKVDIQNNPVKISMKNESEKKVVVEVPDEGTYYLAETDARGNKVDSKFKFTPTLSKNSVEITKDKDEHVDLVNKAKPGTDINTKTGDSANIMLMLMLMITSMLIGIVVLLGGRRREN